MEIKNLFADIPRDRSQEVFEKLAEGDSFQLERIVSHGQSTPHHPDAAGSLLEGLEETFAINRLDLSSALRRCLGSTNIIENPHSGVRMRTRRVSRRRDGKMVLRWAASAFAATEKNFRRILGYRELWMLKAALERYTDDDRDKAA